jgi:hypothetical protein
LLDWGSASQMNVAQSLYGVLCAAETDFWDSHKDELVALFVREYRRHGGPALDVEELGLQMQLFVALLGLAWMIDAPAIIESQIPDLDDVPDRFDPRVRSNFLARAQLQLLTVFLNAWQRGRFGILLEKFHAAHQ